MTTKTDIPSSSFSPPPFRKLTYDVFLSFRGEDTRKNFTDHLYAALKDKGIITFRDDEELERGKSIALELFTAIEESRYVIVVLSRNYANSSWCLDEIAKIVECMEEGTVVLPLFYHVDPSDVRKQTGDHFEKAFSKHEEAFKDEPDKVTRWRRALSQVANLSGWTLGDGYETKVIEEIVEKISTELNERISTTEGLVGMDSHLKKMLSYLDIGRPYVRIIGISGMGGIGKTTIAHEVSRRVKARFEGNSFLENIREVIEKQSPVHLQEKLLSNLLKSTVNVQDTEMGKDIISHRLCTKRVLIVLDDVDQAEQLEALCDRKWFGPGSRIILTSRDEHLLSAFEVDEVYKVNLLTDAEALQLFSLKAFKKDQKVGEEFLKLSKEFLKYASGLPLAIKVLGSSLYGRKKQLWSSALDSLKKNPEKKIINVLKISFDGLEEREKKTFLDIACFFIGEDMDRVIRILEGSDDHCPDYDIEVLMEKSMVTLFGRKLWMHDLILELGREIVREECRGEPGKRSRLWIPKEIIHVLDRSKATSAIESILLQSPTEDNVVCSINDSFSNMDRLRLLHISNVKFSGNIKYISNELQYLEWHECPLDSFPSDFQPYNLVELRMPLSRIKQLWRGGKGWRMLRLINLSDSQCLTSTPDFTEVPELDTLVLDYCIKLVEVHPSLGLLKKLKNLSMKVCISVEIMPPFTSLESLETLNLSLCSRLKKVPEMEGDMKSLLELYLDGTSIEKLPPLVERLTGLTMLSLSYCSKLVEIPENLNCMESLEQLDIGGTAIRDSSFLVGMKNLKSLSCGGCKGDAPRSLLSPASLSSLTSLIELDLGYCNLMDGDIPDDLSSLISLRNLDLSGNRFVRLPESFSQLSKLEILHLQNCRQLELVPKKLPLSLRYVHAEGCTSLTDYPNQIKVLTSVESGVTTINSLIDSSAFGYSQRMWHLNHGESTELHMTRNKHTEVRKFSLPSRVYHEEGRSYSLQSMSTAYFEIYKDDDENLEEISKWFSNTSTSNPISIPIVDKKWKGVAMCAIISVNTTADVEFSNYCYQITVETDDASLEPFVMDDREIQLQIFRSSSNMCLVYYAPSGRFPKRALNESTEVRARFETNNPFVVVQKCGIRLLYEQDAGWNFTGNDEDKCFTCQNNVVLLSGWLSRGDKCLNWEKVIPSSEEENTHVLRKNIESVLPRYLGASNHFTHVFKFNLSGSPAWFHNEVGFLGGMPDRYYPYNKEGTDEMWFADLIEIPQNLHKSKKWMGFAIQASIAVDGIAEEEKQDNYRVHVDLNFTGGDIYSAIKIPWPYVFFVGEIEYTRSSHDQLLVVYIPRAQLPEVLFAETSTTKMLVSFKINSCHVKFQTIGVRVVYQQDIQGLADAIIQCIQRSNSLELYDKLVVKKWIELIRLQGGHLESMSNPKERDTRTRRETEFELHSQKYRNRDWSAPHHLRCNFYGAEISKWKWFMHIKQGNSAEIPLPPNLLDDANWLGIAICAFSRLCPKDRNRNLGRFIPDSEYKAVTCRLDCDGHVLHKWRPFVELDAAGFAKDVTWFLYLPRSDIRFKSGKLARATFSWSSQYLTVQSCALGLVYNKDVEHLVHTLTSCELPANYLERAGVTCESNLARKSMSSTYFRIYKIPKWFGNTSTNNHIGDNKRKGVATYAIFSVNMTADAEFPNYSYKFTLKNDPVRLKDAGRFITNKDEDLTCQNNAVLLSGWLSPGDKCLKWEKFIPPSEEDDYTHVLRKNIEYVLPRYLEALNHSTIVYKFNLSGSPAWFHNKVGVLGRMPDMNYPYNVENVVSAFDLIEIPQNLHKSKKWMGFAIQASIAQEVKAEEEKEDNCRVYLNVYLVMWEIENHDGKLGRELKYIHNVGAIKYTRSSHDQLLVVYIPRALVPEDLVAGTSTFIMHVQFMINSRHVKFQTIGVRVVYQEDIQGLADAIIQCMQRANSLEFYNKLVVLNWIELIRLQGGQLEGVSNPKQRDSRTRRQKEFELHSQKYRNRDWSAPHHLRCNFYGAEISKWKWFMHIKQGNTAEIPLPPNLLDDSDWLGIAICAFSRLYPNDGDSSLGSAVSDSEDNVVTCRLDCDNRHVLHKWTPFTEFDASGFAKDVTWFLYLPRSDIRFKSGKLARATFSWLSQYLTVQSCALGLVYKKNVEHLVHTLTSCELPAYHLERPGVTCESNLADREKFIPPSEEEYSTHVLRKNMECALPRFLEALNHCTLVYKFDQLSGSPAWFHEEIGYFGGMPMSHNVEGTDNMGLCGHIEIPQNLHKSKKWMGFAIQASIPQQVIAEEEKEDNYHVDLRLGTGHGFHKVGAIEYMRSSHDQLLVVYIPRAQLPEALFAETPTFILHAQFMINSRHVKFQTIGVRVVYQEDIQGLADAIIQCMQRANSLELDKFVG